jgi:3-dehydroquinate synthetase/ABC-type sugar transport system substrate-binding protein
MARAIRLGVITKCQKNPFWGSDVRSGLEYQALRSGVHIDFRAPTGIDRESEWQTIIDSLVESGVDVIALAPTDPLKGVDFVIDLNKLRLPVIIFDTQLATEHKDFSWCEYSFVGVDDEEGGRATARYHKHLVPPRSEALIVDGYKSGSYSERIRGYLAEMGDSLSVGSFIAGGFDEATTYGLTLDELSRKPAIRVIYAISDNMAVGAAKAARDLGRNDIVISGFDGTLLGRKALKEGFLASSFDIQPENIGREVVRLAKRLAVSPNRTETVQIFGSLLTGDFFKPLPKQLIGIREYPFVNASPHNDEFDYRLLEHSPICPVVFGSDFEKDLEPRLATLSADRFIIVSDETVDRLYGNRLRESLRRKGHMVRSHTFAPGEHAKNFKNLESLAHAILTEGVTKRSVIVTLGGGITNNIAGFLAAIMMRGIRFVHIPTTTMAQLDVVLGGKQAVNTSHGKNLLGTFYEPEFIYLNPNFITTLSAREYASGLAEAAKHGFCQSEDLLELLKTGSYLDIVRRTLRLKTELLRIDPREQHRGLILLYGHTIGHAIETATNHSVTHGEAVSIGMMIEAEIGRRLGLCDQDLLDRQRDVLSWIGLPTRLPESLNRRAVMNALAYDKKDRSEFLEFFLLQDIGCPAMIDGSYRIPVRPELIADVLANWQCADDDSAGVMVIGQR